MKKPMLLGSNTYGYYFPASKEFHCSHGGWSSPIELLDDTVCSVKFVGNGKPMGYNWLDSIPEEHDYT